MCRKCESRTHCKSRHRRHCKPVCPPCPPCPPPGFDTSLSYAEFGPAECGVSMYKKNVLVIGGSDGIGKGVVEAFKDNDFTTNIVSTSRKPSLYPGQVELDQTPLNIGVGQSVTDFFEDFWTRHGWDHIDILILGGIHIPFGQNGQTTASNMFSMINVELLGRQRVVNHVIQRMKDVKDSRIINLSSAASLLPGFFGMTTYGMCKAAETAWCKQFNAEAIFLNGVSGTEYIKTVAIAFQGSYIDTDAGEFPPELCPAQPGGPDSIPSEFTWQYASGGLLGTTDEFKNTVLGAYQRILKNSLKAGITVFQSGQSILYMATVRDPQWQYVALDPVKDVLCDGTPLAFLLELGSTHKGAKLVLGQYAPNWPTVLNDVINNNNANEYTNFQQPCVPIDPGAPPTIPVRPFRADFPNCTVPDPSPIAFNYVQDKNVTDLLATDCQNPLPCP